MILDSRTINTELKNKIVKFTDLNAWKASHVLVVEIYKITLSFPKSEIFGLSNQVRRAIVSTTSNIAEGFGRRGYKEKIQFYYMAQGSLTEVENQILVACDVCYIDEKCFNLLNDHLGDAQRLLQGLIKKTKELSVV